MRRSHSSLAFGEFIGVPRSRTEAGGFAVSLVLHEGEPVARHGHAAAHVSFALRGEYLSSARERASRSERAYAAGTLLYHPPGTTHEDRFLSERGAFLTISVSPACLDRIEQLGRLPDGSTRIPDQELDWLGTRIASRARGRDAFSSTELEALSLELFGRLVRDAPRFRRGPAPAWLQSALDLMEEGGGHRLRVHQVAREVGVHPVHLARCFRRHLGRSPGEHLRGLRVRQAARLIRAGRTLAESALLAGFGDQSQLTRTFRRVVGMTPGTFRAVLRR